MSVQPSAPTRALIDVAFGSQTRIADTSRPLAWLSAEELTIDLSDPAQRRFGDYELIERIGQGGMGVVYRARQHGLERDVAIKLLAAGPWASAEFVERFRREARAAARMQHPNIVEIYEFGHRDGLNYFSMRLIEGRTLAQRIAADGPLSPIEAARLLRTLAEAMDYAHRLGVLHLDLKPANVLLTTDGQPLIADFGLARRIDAGHETASEIAGTPAYMAPEQALLESHPLSASTDIWGLGAILYEALTGRPPFAGGDAQRTLEQVVGSAPTAPRSLERRIPADLEAICLKCLVKDPSGRYTSARDLVEDLGRFSEGRLVSVRRPAPWERMKRWAQSNRAEFVMWLVLFAGILGTTQQMWRAENAEALAVEQRLLAEEGEEQARASAEQLATAIDLMRGLTYDEEIDPNAVGSMIDLVRSRLGDRPGTSVQLLETVGFTLANRDPGAALVVLDAALDIAQQSYGPNDKRTVSIIRKHGWAAHNSGDLAAAEAYYRRYVSSLEAHFGVDSVEHAHWAPHLALVLLDLGRSAEAEQWSRPALSTLSEKHGRSRDWTLLAAYALGRALLDQGRFAEAEDLLREAADGYESLYAREEGIAIFSRYYLGKALSGSGDPDAGDKLALKSLEESKGHTQWKLMGRELSEAVRRLHAQAQSD